MVLICHNDSRIYKRGDAMKKLQGSSKKAT